MHTYYKRLVGAALCSAVTIVPSIAAAKNLKKPVRIIVAYAAGGASDTVARYVAEKVTAKVGHPVIVENRPGADGNIAAEAVAKSSARDDYTLLVSGPSTHAANATIYKKLPFDPEKDFRPMTTLVNTPYIMVVNPERVKEKNVQDFLQTNKAKVGNVFFASANVGGRIAGEVFRQRAELDAVNVPYKSSPQAITDLIGGEFDYYFCDSVTAIPQIQAGRVNALAVTSPQRMDKLPEVPTLQESGFPDFNVSSWIAIWSAAAMPADESDRLAGWIAEVLNTPEAVAFITSKGLEPMPGTPQQLADIQRRDTVDWGEIIVAAGMQQP